MPWQDGSTNFRNNRASVARRAGELDLESPGVILLGAAAVLVAISVVWRLSSGRRSIPCPSWLAFLVELDNPLFRNNRAIAIVSGLDVKPGMAALDVGCGPGRLAIPLARAVGANGRVVAMDMQQGMLDRARVRAEREGISNITFRLGEIRDGALEPDTHDRAVLVTVLGEIPDQRAALKEIHRSLKKGGVLAITEVIADPHFQRRGRVLSFATDVGFRERSRSGSRLSYTLYLEKPAG
jgi:2-polyprenyl-3-methyl-5-hydroxy-6-metoxy-1,4-benzoquinol methylase